METTKIVPPIKENQMEKKTENEMETMADIGVCIRV